MLSPLALHRHLNNFHGIVAKNIDYLHRDFAPSGQALHEGAFQFQRAVLFGAERLPLIFKDMVVNWVFKDQLLSLLITLTLSLKDTTRRPWQ
ncbi:MAG: hypothetical protein IMY82_02100 [Chloroflexi bacterium]|nr:hypothetical protein [Chloroflexota bacterium]